MKRIVMGFTALTVLAASSAFAADTSKTTTTTTDKTTTTTHTHRQEMHDKWANATPEQRAEMKAHHHHHMMMHEQQGREGNNSYLPAGHPQDGFRNQPVVQH